jgi:hypothetical protein
MLRKCAFDKEIVHVLSVLYRNINSECLLLLLNKGREISVAQITNRRCPRSSKTARTARMSEPSKSGVFRRSGTKPYFAVYDWPLFFRDKSGFSHFTERTSFMRETRICLEFMRANQKQRRLNLTDIVCRISTVVGSLHKALAEHA